MKQLLTVLFLMLTLTFGLSEAVYAADTYTVTFYTDANKTQKIESQKVKEGEYPKAPEKTPKSFEADGFRYEFDKWYWTVDDAVFEYDFESPDCEIWSDVDIYAGYTQYPTKGKELVVISKDGTDFLTDTDTPVTELLNDYYEIESVYTQDEQNYVTGQDNVNANEAESNIKPLLIIVAVLAVVLAGVLAVIFKRIRT